MRLGRDRLAELELVAPLGVQKSPGGAHRPLLASLPPLVKRFDDVVVEVLAFGDGSESRKVLDLLDASRPGVGTHAAIARPTRFADHDRLAGKSRLYLLVDVDDVLLDAARAVGFATIDTDRLVLPIRQYVDGDEVDVVGQGRIAQPEFPDVGIGDRLPHPLLDLADVTPEFVHRQVLPQQDLVADDQPLDRVLVLVGMVDQEVHLLEVLLLVAVQPGAVPHLEAVLAGILRHRFEILGHGVGAHRPDLALETVQILLDLARCREGAAERALARPVRRERHALQWRGGPPGNRHRSVRPPPPQEIERRHRDQSQQRHQGTHV